MKKVNRNMKCYVVLKVIGVGGMVQEVFLQESKAKQYASLSDDLYYVKSYIMDYNQHKDDIIERANKLERKYIISPVSR